MSEKISITNKDFYPYWPMIKDKCRNQFFYDALRKHAKDKVVLDFGCGTGILSSYALSAGAKHVYAIEKDRSMCAIAYKVLNSSFDRSRFTVINKYVEPSAGADLPMVKDPIDILVSETVGPGLFDQGMIHTWDLIKSYMSPDAISIPDRLSCDLWIWQNPFDSDFLNDLEQKTLEAKTLSLDECIDRNFFEAFKKINKEDDHKKMYWVEINDLMNISKNKPDLLYTDKISYSMNNLPKKIEDKFDISLIFDVHTPSSVAVVNKISFESNTLYIKDAPYMPWKNAPMFNLDAPGTYKLSYNNFKYEHLPREEWKVLQKINHFFYQW